MDFQDVLILAGVSILVLGLALVALPLGVLGAGAGLLSLAYLMKDTVTK